MLALLMTSQTLLPDNMAALTAVFPGFRNIDLNKPLNGLKHCCESAVTPNPLAGVPSKPFGLINYFVVDNSYAFIRTFLFLFFKVDLIIIYIYFF